ncbi:Hha/YmoA family nucleoid-associated regulatory protein [Escherichia coli]
MNKADWLLKLRRITEITTLDKVIERKEDTLTPAELVVFYSASDHRYVEIKVGKLFDKIPAHLWTYAR